MPDSRARVVQYCRSDYPDAMPSRGSRPRTPRSAVDPGYTHRVGSQSGTHSVPDEDTTHRGGGGPVRAPKSPEHEMVKALKRGDFEDVEQLAQVSLGALQTLVAEARWLSQRRPELEREAEILEQREEKVAIDERNAEAAKRQREERLDERSEALDEREKKLGPLDTVEQRVRALDEARERAMREQTLHRTARRKADAERGALKKERGALKKQRRELRQGLSALADELRDAADLPTVLGVVKADVAREALGDAEARIREMGSQAQHED